jgi:predicted lipid-binding transport protein (Tim44 family)
MFSFDKLALLLVSLICLGCAMYLAGIEKATAGQATLMGGLVAFLTGAQMIFFSILKAETKAAQMPPSAAPAAPVAAPASAPDPAAAPAAPTPTA